MLQIFISAQFFYSPKKYQTVRFGVELTCDSYYRHDFHFANIEPTPSGIYYILNEEFLHIVVIHYTLTQ